MSRTGLTPAEEETIILWDNEGKTARISTWDAHLITKLDALVQKHPGRFQKENTQVALPALYTVPKRFITVRAPYSEARRQQQIKEAAAGNANFRKGAKIDAEN